MIFGEPDIDIQPVDGSGAPEGQQLQVMIQVYQIDVVPEPNHEFSVNEEESLRLSSPNRPRPRDVHVEVSAWIVPFQRTE